MIELARKIGDRIRELRIKSGLSQEELAFRASLSFNYIGKVERGERNIKFDKLVRIIHTLGISLEEFFSVIDPNVNHKSEPFVEIIKLLSSRSMEEHSKLLEVIKIFVDMADKKGY